MLQRIEEKVFSKIAPPYLVNVKEIASSLNFSFDEDKHLIKFDALDIITDEEAKNYLLKTVSWLEHINYKKALLQAVLSTKKLELERLRSKKFLEIKKKLEDTTSKRITKSDVENLLVDEQDIYELEEKVAIYTAYLQFLEGLYDVLELFHYSIKHARANTQELYNKHNGF